MLLSVTMNPSVDISYRFNKFTLDAVNRVEAVDKTTGGKGLNVARVIAQMGENVLATGVLGGSLGEHIIQELQGSNISHDFLKIDKETRNCISILHEGMQTEILESGPTLSLEEGNAFLEKFEMLLSKITLVTISGSLPKGIPADFYQQMVAACREMGIPVIVDTSGDSLKRVLMGEAKPIAIKPNIDELSQLIEFKVDVEIPSLTQALTNDLFEGIEWVIVSMGEKGAFVRNRGNFYLMTIPKIKVVNPVGSGDAVVAGLAVALNCGKDVETVLKTAMTTGLLNTMEERTGYIELAYFKHYFDLVNVIKIE